MANPESSKTVVVRQFHNYFSAHILKTRLEQEGIHCYLFDENTMTINPVLGFAIGSIKLVVAQKDEAYTLSVLDRFDKEYLAEALCPACKVGTFIQVPRQSSSNIIAAILTWLFSSYAISVNNIYKCRNCGHETETLPDDTGINN